MPVAVRRRRDLGSMPLRNDGSGVPSGRGYAELESVALVVADLRHHRTLGTTAGRGRWPDRAGDAVLARRAEVGDCRSVRVFGTRVRRFAQAFSAVGSW